MTLMTPSFGMPIGRPYFELPALRSILLEESWVLGIHSNPGEIRFDMRFALMPDHPEYSAPAREHRFDFRSGVLEFHGVTESTWRTQGAAPDSNREGQLDYGHIDSMAFRDSHFALQGAWGELTFTAGSSGVWLSVRADAPAQLLSI